MEMNTKELISRANNFFNGDASYGDAAMKILEGVTSDGALKNAEKNTHSAAELVAHIIGWEEVYLKRAKGDPTATIDQELSFDWKRIDKNEKTAWRSLVTGFETNHKELISILEEDRYDMQVKETLLNSIMEHDIYHLAQIAFIKKMVSSKHNFGGMIHFL